ncbi:transmembrane protein 26-like isoform X3 [Conger conger]|uniref:transmembrane protein 26-like isoform X3 n=1 Tax=Conger conger TaxID=82655 RepID=UPI002A5B0FBA|nr:transmembrane protein 26-like isoform X3 [Conger conger]
MIPTFIRAIITRLSFIILSLIAIWRVKHVKNDNRFWFLTFLWLPLIVEMIINLKVRMGKDYKWFSPTILLVLITIIPPIWILELHHRHDEKLENKLSWLPDFPHGVPTTRLPSPSCKKLDSWDSVEKMMSSNDTVLKQVKALQHKLCPDDWILGLHQTLIILLILGKWAMPQANDLTKDKLPQLLLIFVGLGADILEFTNETLSDIKENNPQMAYAILGVWTWSMLQFTLHLAVVSESRSDKSPAMWSIAESIFIQDGPFLVVRLIVLIRYKIFHQMLVFFTFKNLLVVTLNIYWFCFVCRDRGSTPTSTPRDSISV